MSYYKYLSNKRADVLEQGSIRFTQPSAFNDPFEALPTFKTLGEEFTLKNLAGDIYNPFLNESKHLVDDTHVFPREEIESLYTSKHQSFMRIESKLCNDLTRVIRDAFDKSYGILSLTKNPKSILMWSHYANNHKGYLLEFDEHHPFFSAHIKMKPVVYSSIRSEDELIPKSGLKRYRNLFKKSIQWHYEEEWRVVAELKKSKKKIVCKPFDIHLFELPSDAIKSIVVGYLATNRFKNKIRRLISSRRELKQVRLLQAVLHPSEFEFQHVEV